MSNNSCSINALISTYLLSDYRVLQSAWEIPFSKPLEWRALREQVYLAYQPWSARHPDHVFDTSWNSLVLRSRERHFEVLSILSALSGEFLEIRHGNTYVVGNLFGVWQQSLISRMSSMGVHAAARARHSTPYYQDNLSDGIRLGSASQERQVFPLLRPFVPIVEDFVTSEGLNETHLHLNGSTQAEACWLRAIRDSKAETNEFVVAWTRGKNSSRVREIVSQVDPALNPVAFFRRLTVAGRIRSWLAYAASCSNVSDVLFPSSCEDLLGSDPRAIFAPPPSSGNEVGFDLHDELSLLVGVIRNISIAKNTRVLRMFHLYLLLQNQYYRLMVQREDQYGFDQFQKLTLTELREPAERNYEYRFRAMHGSQRTLSIVRYSEGRFAPKMTLVKSYSLLHSILRGYLNYVRDVCGMRDFSGAKSLTSLSHVLAELDRIFASGLGSRDVHRLALVAHFVKQSWTVSASAAGPYRYYSLASNLRQCTGVLLVMLQRWPRLKVWLRGIDAAANELHAPPEVFAPAFRVCQRFGIPGRSFHAGEDFPHLLAGLGYMWDAIQLLNLRDGDRIGHGTAMGICPKLWVDRMPSKIMLSRGEWLTSLLAAIQLLRGEAGAHAQITVLEREIEECAFEIFGIWNPLSQVERAMALRGLCRHALLRLYSESSVEHSESLNDGWNEELIKVRAAYKHRSEDVDVLWSWLSDKDTIERSEFLVERDADFFDYSTYVQIQQSLMKEISRRSVVVETLPSSNVRISQYVGFHEHHALRWMQIPGYFKAGDVNIEVSLGSDDPGVFAGDLETEFHQLYAALRSVGLSESAAISELKKLNDRGRIYRFHDRLLA